MHMRGYDRLSWTEKKDTVRDRETGECDDISDVVAESVNVSLLLLCLPTESSACIAQALKPLSQP